MELKTETPAVIGGMSREIFEAARKSGLSVSTGQSTFNRQLLNFEAARTGPLLARIEVLSESIRACIAENDRLKIELAELRDAAKRPAVTRLPADDTEGGGL